MGYRLVAACRDGHNLFFVREDEEKANLFPDVDLRRVLEKDFLLTRRVRDVEKITNFEWQAV